MNALFSTFGLVFLAELGDKTQLAVVTQTCKYRRPWPVFLGAALGLSAVTAIGAAGGRLLSQLIPPHVLQFGAAAAFVLMGLLIAREAHQAWSRASESDCDVLCQPDDPLDRCKDWKILGSTLGLLFVAEMGDKTQLAILSLAGKSQNPWMVFIGGALALVTVTAVGVVGGQGLCKIVPERVLLWVSAVAFVLMGLLIGHGVL